MSLQLEDFKGKLEAVTQKKAQTRILDLRGTQQTALLMSEFSADPKWQRYVQLIEEKKQAWDTNRKNAQAKLDAEFLDPITYGVVKVAIAKAEGWVAALAEATGLVADLLKKGEAAREEIGEITEKFGPGT